MSSHYFLKPQPISPLTRTKVIDGVRKQFKKGKWVNVFGVPIKESIYFYWFEYLRLSENYKKACGIEVDFTKEEKKAYLTWYKQYGKELFKDFGNVHSKQYEGDKGFWAWWNEKDKESETRGERLFGIKAKSDGNSWLSFTDVKSLQGDIDENKIKVYAVETNLSKIAVLKRFKKLLYRTKDIAKKDNEDSLKPKYSHAQDKVNIPSLAKCLKVYDEVKIQGLDVFRVGCRLAYREDKEEELSKDGRSKERQYSREKLEIKNEDEYWALVNKVTEQMKKKQKKEDAYWKQIKAEDDELNNPQMKTRDEVLNNKGGFDSTKGLDRVGDRKFVNYLSEENIEQEMLIQGGRITDKQRTRSKSAMRTNTYKLINKAKKNIEAVEIGTFGVGH
jgi:hypothetical protein